MLEIAKLKTSLRKHEGVRLKPYVDTTGNTTIGVGRNLTSVGISSAESEYLLDNDISIAVSHLDITLPWWRSMADARQLVLAEMCFNLGIDRLVGFKLAIQAMEGGNYPEAAHQMLTSHWASQVGPARSGVLADMMRYGTYPQET